MEIDDPLGIFKLFLILINVVYMYHEIKLIISRTDHSNIQAKRNQKIKGLDDASICIQ